MGRVADPSRMSGFSAPHCGSLRSSDEGRELELYGWVARRRDHGGLIFIDLRDRWGPVQVVFNPANAPQAHMKASDLRSEYVVRVEGKVARRRAGAENPRMPTGEVEVVASDLEVISVAKTPPFAIEDDVEADEATRLKYRYLDIRRPKMTHNLELRHRVVQAIHRYMDAHEFMEVETPMLLKGTPEGSRDFIVPSRLHPGEFFALPQSLLKYGTDKPDLRFDLEIADVSDALRETGATVLRGALDAGGVVRCFAVPGGKDMSRRELDDLAVLARGAGAKGLAWVPGPLDRHLSEGEMAAIKSAAGAGADDIVLLVADRRRKAETVMGLLRREIARRRKLVRHGEWNFLWVYPMYLFEEDDLGNLTYGHHPFTSPWPEDMALLAERPYDVRARAYDCVLNGVEISGGSIRIHDRELQERVFGILGMDEERIRTQFGHLLDAFEYGVPPHGGIAAGIDRLMMAIVETDNIRDVVAFPRTQSHQDLMLGAPSPVDPMQLEELHIQVVPPRKPVS